MSLNAIKCKCLCFPLSPVDICHQMLLKEIPLQYTSEYKYLGLRLAPTLSWSAHINKIVSSVYFSLAYIRRSFRSASSTLKRILYITVR